MNRLAGSRIMFGFAASRRISTLCLRKHISESVGLQSRLMSSDAHSPKTASQIVKDKRPTTVTIQGQHETYYNHKDTNWTRQFAAGAVFLAFTGFMMNRLGVFELFGVSPIDTSINQASSSLKKEEPEKNPTVFISSPKDEAKTKPSSDAPVKETLTGTETSTKQPLGKEPPKDEVAAPLEKPVEGATGDAPQVTGKPKFDEPIPYLIIGGGTAAFAAYRAIRSKDPKAKVLIVTEEDKTPYMKPPLSKEMWFSDDTEAVKQLRFKQWNGRERTIFFEKDQYYCEPDDLMNLPNGGVAIMKRSKVVSLNVDRKKVTLKNNTEFEYEKCLLATGSTPKHHPIIEAAGEKVATRTTLLKSAEDFLKLYKIVENNAADMSIAVIGGGFLGSELACALGKKGSESGLTVYQCYPESGNMGKILPTYLGEWTIKKVQAESVKVMPHSAVTACNFDNDKVNLHFQNGDKLSVDHVVVAVGSKPNVELANSAKLEVDAKTQGFLVNAELEARSNVWAAGDASCFYDVNLGRRQIEHHDHAVVSGRVAGQNMTGAQKPYTHQPMFWSDLGPEIGFEAIGIVESALPTVGVFAKATEQDTPKANVEVSEREIGSEMKNVEQRPVDTPKAKNTVGKEDYGKGVVFYMKENTVVGILLWNVFNKVATARQIINGAVSSTEVNELAKLFDLYGSKKDTIESESTK